MDNQHRKISGYRELSQNEIDLMNEIKAFGPQLAQLIGKVEEHIGIQVEKANSMETDEEVERLDAAGPRRWAAIAKKDLQTGLMALTRAVAQPTFF
ncbi:MULTISPECIES: hypothetical protein [unclassified Pseudomonas]|uniref:Acb2/Tad1 domain-containing protein n=1 Tax=unclassified Pseudomonas TaxID=196821 RepID=UPI0007305501|nr:MULTISPECIES: hypothetical protein [unclassified Pseudomonas]KSW21598.1 hypothetical protein AOX63_31190 [Pseudomonas sp. ADP]OBP09733.1 hypothetical protein BAE52_17740 [Pseudomonas sp. EGD-AKN5]QOF85613.1 hypothetical protein IG194_02570 [Pseudomonas sp. ADPe]